MLQSKKLTIALHQPAPTTVRQILANGDQPLYVGRLVGIATGQKSGIAQYGEWFALVGDFVKTAPDGTIERAPLAFGPDLVIEPVRMQLAASGGVCNVAVDVFAVIDEKAPSGFAYRARSVIPDAEDSPMARLLAMAGATARPAIAAPASVQTAEPVAEATPAKPKKA